MIKLQAPRECVGWWRTLLGVGWLHWVLPLKATQKKSGSARTAAFCSHQQLQPRRRGTCSSLCCRPTSCCPFPSESTGAFAVPPTCRWVSPDSGAGRWGQRSWYREFQWPSGFQSPCGRDPPGSCSSSALSSGCGAPALNYASLSPAEQRSNRSEPALPLLGRSYNTWTQQWQEHTSLGHTRHTQTTPQTRNLTCFCCYTHVENYVIIKDYVPHNATDYTHICTCTSFIFLGMTVFFVILFLYILYTFSSSICSILFGILAV